MKSDYKIVRENGIVVMMMCVQYMMLATLHFATHLQLGHVSHMQLIFFVAISTIADLPSNRVAIADFIMPAKKTTSSRHFFRCWPIFLHFHYFIRTHLAYFHTRTDYTGQFARICISIRWMIETILLSNGMWHVLRDKQITNIRWMLEYVKYSNSSQLTIQFSHIPMLNYGMRFPLDIIDWRSCYMYW